MVFIDSFYRNSSSPYAIVLSLIPPSTPTTYDLATMHAVQTTTDDTSCQKLDLTVGQKMNFKMLTAHEAQCG